MKRRLKTTAAALALAFAAAQLVQPKVANPPVDSARSLWHDPHMDQRVTGILRQACGDCHSNETRWPWYSKISPISWLIARDVEHGRAKLNFSEWSASPADQLEEIYDSIVKNKMPMASYTWIHPAAKLSRSNREAVLTWVDGKLAQAALR